MRNTFKWIGIVLAALLTIAIIFHRPIFFRLTRYFVVRAAEQQNLSIDYKMSGSIFTGLQITELHATPTEPGPVERLEVGSLRLEYSLWGLLRDGLPGFLDRVAIADVVAVIDPAKQLTPEKAQKDQSFKFPALIPEELSIENLDLTWRMAGEDVVINDFDLLLHPTREGWIRAETVQIPGVHTWKGLQASASYADRNLVLTNLELGPEMQFRRLNLDMSELSKDVLAFGLEATLFGGATTASGQITDLNEASVLTLTAKSKSNSLAEASRYFGFVPPLDGMVEELSLSLSGTIAKPVTWSGAATVAVEDFEGFKITAPTDAKVDIKIADGKAVVQSLALLQGENKISGTATVDLPKTFDGFAELNANGSIAADLKNVGGLTNGAAEGALDVQGKFTSKDGDLVADLHAKTDHLTSTEGEVRNADVRVQIEKDLASAGASIWKGLETAVTGTAGELRFKEYQADSAEFNITSRDDHVQVNNLTASSGENKVDLKGEFTLPDDPAKFDQNLVNLELNIAAPNLKQLVAQKTGKRLEGDLSVSGKLTRKSGLLNGNVTLSGTSVNYAGVSIPRINAEVQVTDGVVELQQLHVALPEGGAVDATGRYDLKAPNRYSGELHAKVKELSIYEPLLRSIGNQAELGGSIELDWRGSGTLHPQSHDGAATIAVRGARYNSIRGLNADVSGVYSPESIQVPMFQVSSDMGGASAHIEVREQALRVTNLVVQQERSEVLRGELTVPIDLTKINAPADLLSEDGVVFADIQSKKLNLAKLPALEEQQLRGTITARLQASGTVRDLQATLAIEGRSLRAAATGKLAGADVDVTVALDDDRLALDASLRQPQIQPLQITGNVPFNLARVFRRGGIDPTAPLDLAVKLPRSSLGFVSKLSPAIRYAEGTVALDAKVNGTVREPELSGSATIRFPALRLRNTTIANISDGRIELQLRERTLSIETAEMRVGGGPLSATGTVQFSELTKPALDLRIDGKSVLVMRNDDVTVRTDLDLSVKGPMESAHVAGSVGITQSQILREVELLPIGLPGRPPPPGLPESATTASIEVPPIRDWTFDVAIKTVDPFKIRGNLANGGVVADLRLTGTGLEPRLDGTATANDLVLSLPFSRLHVRRGTAYFSPDGAVMNPRLDISAVSEVRDYRINVYIYGTAEDPKTTFSSQPPLPQEEIIALLATGATFEELTGNANVVAGRAGWLLLQKLYRKVFGGGSGSGDSDFLDRFDVNLGPPDPQTGEQSIVTRFRIDENWVLIGTTGIEGGVQGKVKYLIRFR